MTLIVMVFAEAIFQQSNQNHNQPVISFPYFNPVCFYLEHHHHFRLQNWERHWSVELLKMAPQYSINE